MKFEYNADTHMSNDFLASDSFELGSVIPTTKRVYNNSSISGNSSGNNREGIKKNGAEIMKSVLIRIFVGIFPFFIAS